MKERKIKMSLKNKMFSALLAGSMGLAMVSPVMAQESTVTPSTTIPTIEKTVTANQGLTFSETFTFNVTALDNTDEIADKTITVNLTEGQTNGGATVSTALVDDTDLTELKKLVPGEYIYTVTENEGTTTGMTYDTKSYKLHVYVKYKKDVHGNYTDEKEISYILVSAEGKVDGGTSGLKLAFNNVFKPTVNFTVDKVVKGDYADKTQKFDIDVTYTNANGDIKTETIQNSHDDAAQEFTALAGTTITVTEKDSLGYTTKYTYDSSDVNSVKDTLLTWNQTDVSKVHEVKVINTKEAITPTGIIMNNLPFILLVVLGTAGVGFYLASKRRMN